MDLMKEWLTKAAKELGLRITIAPAIPIADGRQITFDALFSDLGNLSGTLVLRSSELSKIDQDVRSELKRKGYGFSSFDEPHQRENFDINNYIEMFAEWGWSGPNREKPNWMS
jgi:hypothetical protein